MSGSSKTVWLATQSSIVRHGVEASLSSMNIEISTSPRDSDLLRLIHVDHNLEAAESWESPVPTIVIGSPVPKVLNDRAAAVIKYPFLSNDLRKVVSKVLQLSVPDATEYRQADQPVPVARKKPQIPAAPETASKPIELSKASPIKAPPTIPTFRPHDDLPEVSDNELLSNLHHAEDTVVPSAVKPEPGEQTRASLGRSELEGISEAYIEKVVWEVVPKLAERLLREEIARILKR